MTSPVSAPLPSDEPESHATHERRGKDNTAHSLAERWRAVIDTVREASVRHATSLMNATIVALRPGEVIVGFAPDQGFHRFQATSPAGKQIFEQAFATHFGKPTRLVIDDAAAAQVDNGPSLAEQARRGRAVRERSVEEKVRTHPSILTALRALGGEVEHITLLDPETPAAPAAESAEE